MTWWEELRNDFPVTQSCTYMDTAFDCGGSLIGKAAAARYFDDWHQAASKGIKGGPGRKPFFETAARGREAIAQLIGGVNDQNIVYTKNTNEGINIIMQGFSFPPGANIITAYSEYPSVIMPCLNAEKLRGVECRLALPGADSHVTWEDLWALADDQTAMIAVSHVQSSTGYQIDLKALGEKCRERGIFLIVDAVQSLGLARLEAEEWGVSAVSGAGYKGLGAFISLGFLYCCDRLLARIEPVYVSNNFGMSLNDATDRPQILINRNRGALFLENCSTDYLGVYVLEAAVRRLLDIGLDKIEAHIDSLYVQLYDGLKALGYRIITPREKDHRCAAIAVACQDGNALREHFFKKNVIISGGTKQVRISIGPYTSPQDIASTLEAAKSWPLR